MLILIPTVILIVQLTYFNDKLGKHIMDFYYLAFHTKGIAHKGLYVGENTDRLPSTPSWD